MQKSKLHVPKLLRDVNRQPVSTRHAISSKARFLCCTLFAILAMAALAPRADAQNYTAATDAQLRQAIIDANSDGFPTSTITLTGDIALASVDSLTTATKPIIIDTGPFKLTGMAAVGNGSGGTLQFGGNVTLRGTTQGGDASATPLDAHPGTGGVAVTQTDGTLQNEAAVTGGTGGAGGRFSSAAVGGIGGVGMELTGTTLVNQGSVTGGAGGNFSNGFSSGSGSNVAAGAGGTGLVLSGGSLDNRGNITGGAGGSMLDATAGDNQFGGAGGTAAIITGGSHSNSGSITGGVGGAGVNVPGPGAGVGGSGLVLDNGSIINSGTGSITGGSGVLESFSARGSSGGTGVTLHASSIQNDGVITGGLGAGTTGVGGVGLNADAGSTVTNTNRIAGGDGATAGNAVSGAGFAIVNTGTIAGGSRTTSAAAGGIAISGSDLNIVNSGAITPGSNNVGTIVANSTAIQFTAGANSLELRNGSAIQGLVLAGGTADTLDLGGSDNDMFDVSQIGATAQYQGFEAYEKTGNSIWTLTGSTAAVTPWTLRAGELSVDNDSQLGATSGTLTLDGGTLQITGVGFSFPLRPVVLGDAGGSFDIADPGNTFTLSQALSGTGALTKLGDGTMILTGDNTYTGGTTISGGSLEIGNHSTTGSIVGDVVNNGDLEFGRSDDVTFGGVVSGTGTVGKVASGKIILTGDNTYTGGTLLLEGSMQLGNGGTSGSIVSNVQLNGTHLAFDRSNTLTYGGVIFGPGWIDQIGTGKTILTGDNIYSFGNATISAGTLQLGNGGRSGSITSDVVDNGTFIFDRADTTVFAHAISGTGSVEQIGSGATYLNGANSYTGATVIRAGTLGVAGFNNISQSSGVQADGTLDLSRRFGGTMAIKQLSGHGVVNLGTTSVVLGGSQTFDGTILGSGGLLIQGGSPTLTGANTYQGATEIQSGTLALSGNGSIANSSSVKDNGTFDISGTTAGASITTLSGTGTLALGTRTLSITKGDTVAFSGDIAGTGGLTVTHGGTRLSAVDVGARTIAVTSNGESGYQGTILQLVNNSTVGASTLSVDNAAQIEFRDGSAATDATFAVNDGGMLAFTDNSSSGSSHVTVNNHGLFALEQNGSAGGATVVNNAGGEIDVVLSNGAAAIGSLSGAGSVFLGNQSVTLGGLNSDDIISGVIADGVSHGMDDYSGGHGFLFSPLTGGSLLKTGTGTLTLSGANSYTGATTVSSGTLLVDGDQSLATGDATIASGATIGGTGTIGGNVMIANGGVLSPGDAGSAPGTLTIREDLSLNSGSLLNYNFGQANVIGGPLNDLVKVRGNLTLDGIMNVTTPPGGSFDPGIYRVISYDGTLSGPGFAAANVPSPDFLVQSSIAHQVNLINTNGLTLNFWDGPSNKFNTFVDGGTGTWQSSAGNDNWTENTGVVNASYANAAFAIFAAAPGTVTVDTSMGIVSASGMQFASDGYRVEGAPVTLIGSNTTIRVGDGTTDGSSYTTTFNSELTGAASLNKTDLGTLVLAGANTYTGATVIQDGTLALTGLGSIAASSGLTDNGTFDISGTNAGASISTLSGAGVVDVGDKTLTLTAGSGVLQASEFSGSFRGTGGLSLTSSAEVLSGVDTRGLTVAVTGNGSGAGYADASLSYAQGSTVSGSGALSVSNEAQLLFADVSSAGNASITVDNRGLVGFAENSDAASSVTSVNNGGLFAVIANAQAGGATVINNAGGIVDVSLTDVLAGVGSDRASIGSLSGAGNVYLGASALTLGGLDGTETIAGRISDGSSADLKDYVAGLGGSVPVLTGGSLVKAGTGNLTLTGANSYTGATTIDAGTLSVNGDQSLATGLTSVNDGGTLGGSGTVGGDVTVADGGAIVPGNSPGTLRINGDLSLSSGSSLNLELNQANVAGGASNDLIKVGGDLTLDGTLNVSTLGGTSFGAGTYRLLDYDGSLVDHGLSLGVMPSGNTSFLQTAIAHQVNLINTDGLTLNYWDGATGLLHQGVVDGGTGLWQNSTGNSNWTLSTGTTNAGYSDGAFAVFQGTAGTVTVDNSLGGVSASGMQFGTDGYRVEGGELALIGSSAVLRVGDGSADGANYTATVASELTGAAAVEKTDFGTLVLAADNSYTGGTSISDGTVQLGEGGTTGSILGDVADNGTLAFDRSDAVTFAGAISGSGAVNQVGSGTTTLTGVNSYAGGTTISGGTIAGSVSSFGTGTIVDNAALVIDQPADATFSNAINGSGSFTKRGAGLLNYTGVGNLNGSTTVSAGTLAMNGALANSALTVANTATLTGTGRVSSSTIETGGTVAPGNDATGNKLGTLSVNGAYSQAAGSTYQVEVDPGSSASDLISVTGAADITDGAILNVTKTTQTDYRIGTRYTVLSAAGGVTGTYDLTGDTTMVSSFLGLVDGYDANNVYLTVQQTRDLADVSATQNQTSVAGGLESLPNTSTLLTAILNSQDDLAARTALDQLSGEIRASAQTASLEDSRFVRDAAVSRVRDTFCSVATINERSDSDKCAAATRYSVWGQAFGSWARSNGNANASTINHTTGGVFLGIDAPLSNGWRLGMLSGYGHSSLDVKDRNSSGSSNDYHVGIYGGNTWNDVSLRTGATYTIHGITTNRTVTLPDFADALVGDYNSNVAQLFGDLGYKIGGRRVALEPFGNLAYVDVHSDGFSEHGIEPSGEAALSSTGNSTNMVFTTLGLRPSASFMLGATNTSLRGSLGWRHAAGDTEPISALSFSGGSSFDVSGVPLAQDAAVIEAGLDFNVSTRAILGLTYGGQFGEGMLNQDIRGNVTLLF